MEYYSAIERMKSCHFQQHEGIKLCEMSARKDKYCMISLICEILKTKQNSYRYREQNKWLLEEGVGREKK